MRPGQACPEGPPQAKRRMKGERRPLLTLLPRRGYRRSNGRKEANVPAGCPCQRQALLAFHVTKFPFGSDLADHHLARTSARACRSRLKSYWRGKARRAPAAIHGADALYRVRRLFRYSIQEKAPKKRILIIPQFPFICQ